MLHMKEQPVKNPRVSLDDFRAMDLVSSFVSLEFPCGNVVRHEVRRDPTSGLTLTAKFPMDNTEMQERKRNHHG